VVKLMIRKEHPVKEAKILQLGVTFKENCPDIRNSKAVDVAYGLQEFGCEVTIFDPWANPDAVRKEYGLSSVNKLPQTRFDAVVLAVAHREFAELDVRMLLKNPDGVIYDIKGFLPKDVCDGRL